ncbi:hypothetical protein JKP88DRAFT_287453 [Tribonema minus]|uniref:Glucose/Sorbosone dehydrogenase domain-containing protein n=1 Tax=Tribonema minus TaxID=303371 RepID=A0A835Z8E6_9STRA|nr:hypothetical protein JKP88DRAFT_287453 [Tribonema minus]
MSDIVTALLVAGHAACLPDYTPVAAAAITADNGVFCPEPRADPDGMCCTKADEDRVQQNYAATLPAGATDACKDYHRQALCVACQPWAYHLYIRADDPATRQPLLCPAFCASYRDACGLPADFCAAHADTSGYCYPDVVKAPPGTRTGTGFAAYFTGAEATSIMRSNYLRGMAKVPGSGNPGSWYIWEARGKVWQVPNRSSAVAADAKLILDISSKITVVEEQCLQFVAFTPDWSVNKCFYATYNKKSATASQDGDLQAAACVAKLSRFCLQAAGAPTETQIVLIDRPSGARIHNGGWIGFAKADYDATYTATATFQLFMTVGDSTQPTKVRDMYTPFGKMLRFNVRVGTSGIHSNERECAAATRGAAIGAVKGAQHKAVYAAPTDNPFWTSADTTNWKGRVWAYGLRNPYRCSYWPSLWCGDAGASRLEEVQPIVKGNFYGWPIWEGTSCYATQEECNANPSYTKPLFQARDRWCQNPNSYTSAVCSVTQDIYDAASSPGVNDGLGGCSTGGAFYTGECTEFKDRLMSGAYIFGDYQKQAIMMLRQEGSAWKKYTLYTALQGPFKVIGFFNDPDTGDVFVMDISGGGTSFPSEGLAQITKLGCGNQCGSVTPPPTSNVPDPGCDRGIKHPDATKKTCCAAECRDAGGNSICGTTACGSTGKSASCCNSGIAALNKPCTANAPACSPYITADPKCQFGFKHPDPAKKSCCPYTCRDASGASICGTSACGSTNKASSCCHSGIIALNRACASFVAPCSPYAL